MPRPRTQRDGKPSKLVPSIVNRFLEAIRAGNYLKPSAAYAGISLQTMYTWMYKGRREDSGPFHDFYVQVCEAEAEAEMRMVEQWTAAAPDDWRARAHFLARRFPERWASKSSDPADVTVKIEHGTNSEDHAADPSYRTKEDRTIDFEAESDLRGA